jgi:hypothetical protein
MFKILCTGNPEHIGIAQEIKKLFPDADFISRTNGYDLSTPDGINKLKSILKNYNVFINNAHVGRNTQSLILSIVRGEWSAGHVFNIGTSDEYAKWLPAHPENYKEKNELKELGLSMTDENFKVTHVTVGAFKSSAKPRGIKYSMDPKHIASTISWAMNAEFQIPVVGVEQINDGIRTYYKMKKEGLI